MKNQLIIYLMISVFFLSCSLADDVKDTFDAVECANLMNRISENDSDKCSQTIADIDQLLNGSCSEFITTEQREDLIFIKENCTDE